MPAIVPDPETHVLQCRAARRGRAFMTRMTEREVDPIIQDAVHNIVNRFGAPGLEDLIDLAQRELAIAREELRKLAE
jgi:hypothetical protein